MIAISNPYPQFFDQGGTALDYGYVYFGSPNLDPQTNPVAIYWDAAGTIPATNPVRTMNGYIVNGSTPALVYTASNYSIRVKDAGMVTLWSAPNSLNFSVQAMSEAALTAFKTELATKNSSTLGAYLVGYAARTVHDRLNDNKTIKDFGAVGNASTACRAAVSDASAYGRVIVPPGEYKIESSLTITAPVEMQGGVFQIPTGVTLTINGPFTAGVEKCFNCVGTGEVVFDNSKVYSGYMEWWGAIPNSVDARTGNTAAFTAAQKALRKIEMMPADYIFSSTCRMVTPNTYLKGAGAYYQDTANSATRILCYDGTVDALQIGPDTMAATINDFTKGLRVSDVFVQFYNAPNIPSGRAAVRNQYTLGAIIDDVRTGDAIKGFWFYGTVFTTANRCYASRATAGTGGGTDIWWGYHVDGSVVVPSVTGGNASVYLNYCSASCGLIPLQTGNSSGFYIDFKFSDTFLNHTESVNCNVGINVQGDGSTSATTTNVDLQINHATNDAFKSYGIFFNNVNKFGSVGVHGGYQGPSTGAVAGVQIQSCLGSVSLHGGQFVMINAPTAKGVVIEGSAQANVLFTQILECGTFAVDVNNSVNCKLFPVVKNHSTTLSGAVIRQLNASNRNELRPSLTGKSSAAALGIQLVSTGSGYNEINPTGIEPAALAGGASGKVVINGVAITATGLSGTNLVSGVMN